MSDLKWSYGITTVPDRRGVLLPRTLHSLAAAGFSRPRLFVDGADDGAVYSNLDLPMTLRSPRIYTPANWVLAVCELYFRDHAADRYLLFQDDVVAYRNLRQYLEQCDYPYHGYCNLYTFPENQRLAARGYTGWYESNQRGLGAVGLMFDNEAVLSLLSNGHLFQRVKDDKNFKQYRSIDGGVYTSMKRAGYKEYVHSPSLVQHVGAESAIGNKQHPQATSFKGEQFDALTLVRKGVGHVT